jgi:regulator of protease activity HflC (stomatin/prohibitin superfamily)
MDRQLVLGILIGLLVIPVTALLTRLLHVEVDDGEAVLVTRFGKLAQTIRRPGWHWVLDRAAPWARLLRVNLRREFRQIEEIFVNDASGTTVVVDVWLELRVEDPVRSSFAIADWNRALHNLVSHAVISILGSREFKQILSDRTQLGELLRKDISAETARWGIEIDQVFIKNVSLLPEVSQQVFQSVAAHLLRAKADVEENGRQRAALLKAETGARTAALLAEARGQYPQAVGRAYAALRQQPEVLSAYQELYELSLLKPQSLVAFKGFSEGELRHIDAAMLAPMSAGQG